MDAGDGEAFLLLRTKDHKVIERQIFTNHRGSGRTCVYGFTHFVRLPNYL